MQFLNEVYFGKKPIANLQKQLSIIRKGIRAGKIKSGVDSDMLKFNRLAEKFFGFHQFSINIDYALGYQNAFTIPVDIFFSDKEKEALKKALIASPEGFKYTKSFAKISAVVFIGYMVWFNDDLSDEEIMAIILHEIGHCFYDAVIQPDNYFTSLRKCNNMFESIDFFIKDKVKRKSNVTPEIVVSDLKTIGSVIYDVKSFFSNIKSKMFHESMEDNFTHNKYAYTAEKFADSFATMYGYGPELTSALVMITVGPEHNNFVLHMPISECLVLIGAIVRNYLLFLLTPDSYNEAFVHPELLARIKYTIDNIKRELNKEKIDPALKRELLDELKRSEKVLNKFNSVPSYLDYFTVYRKYVKFLYRFFEGDFREPGSDNDAFFDSIDNRYDDLMK